MERGAEAAIPVVSFYFFFFFFFFFFFKKKLSPLPTWG